MRASVLDCVCLSAALSRAEMDSRYRSNGHFYSGIPVENKLVNPRLIVCSEFDVGCSFNRILL